MATCGVEFFGTSQILQFSLVGTNIAVLLSSTGLDDDQVRAQRNYDVNFGKYHVT